MSDPLEIVAAPLTLYVAPTGTSFPDVDETPGAGWTKIGTSGPKNYTEDGVVVTHEQELSAFTPAGSTAKQKVWRVTEGLKIEVTLADISAAQYAKILNDATVTTTPAGGGTPGHKEFSLLQGKDVALFALLARGESSEAAGLAAQYEVPIAYQSESPAPAYKKGEPAGLKLAFEALEDSTAGFGTLVIQTAAAS